MRDELLVLEGWTALRGQVRLKAHRQIPVPGCATVFACHRERRREGGGDRR
jgi:hypothetical protein